MAKNHILEVDYILTFGVSEALNHPKALPNRRQFRTNIPFIYSKHTKADEIYVKILDTLHVFMTDQNLPSEKLMKISTAANWTEFRKVTGQNTDFWLSQNGKFWFGRNRDDLIQYEKDLMSEYGWGTGVDYPAHVEAVKHAQTNGLFYPPLTPVEVTPSLQV